VDMKLAFGSKSFLEIYKDMSSNLNISSINVIGLRSWEDEYPYTLDSEDWKQIQIDYLKKGYESRNLR
jgi:hypothetical protein